MNQPEMRAWLKATHKPGSVTDGTKVSSPRTPAHWSHAAVADNLRIG